MVLWKLSNMLKLQCCCLSVPLLLLLVFANYSRVFAAESSSSSSSSIAQSGSSLDGSTSDAAGVKGKLLFANVLFRHGDRMPIDLYPNDPWRNPEFWPNDWGQLTNRGKEEHYHLGQWLRKRYDSILNRSYSGNEIYVRSTDVDRTLMSAMANLAGLYPPTGDQVWNKDIAWQPIPVHTNSEIYDELLAGKSPCPAYDHALSSLLTSPEFQSMKERYAYLFDYLTKYTGRKVNSFVGVQFLNSTFFIESLYNKTLPEWTKKVYPSTDMTYLANFAFSINTYTRNMARLKIGPLIKEMLERFKDKVQGKLNPDRSVWMYSAHDTTLASVLNTLNLFDLHSPPYIACILIELREDDKKNPFISVYYKNTTADPLPMHIPGCGIACPLNKMFTLYKDILPEDWSSECKLSTMSMTYEEANVGMAMGILVAIISVMMFLSYVVTIYYRRRSYRTYSSYSQVA